MNPLGRGRDRSHQAKRAVILRRLVMDEWLDELDAEDRLSSWESLAEELGRDRGAVGYWDEGWRWITATHPSTPGRGRPGDRERAVELDTLSG